MGEKGGFESVALTSNQIPSHHHMLQSRVLISAGRGPGLSHQYLGEKRGEENVILNQQQMPVHTHNLQCVIDNPPQKASKTAEGNFLGKSEDKTYSNKIDDGLTQMNPSSVGFAGHGMEHNNLQPYLVLNYCIALTGLFPCRW